MSTDSERRPRSVNAVVIGVGNRYRGDDGVGLAVAGMVRERAAGHVAVVELDGEATSVIEAWHGCDLAIVVDAVRGGGDVGEILCFDALEDGLPAEPFKHSTHLFGIGGAVAIGRAIGRLPRRLLVFGIEGENFEMGTELTTPVEAAVAEAAERVLRELPPDKPNQPS